jgi:hypothetical protein
MFTERLTSRSRPDRRFPTLILSFIPSNIIGIDTDRWCASGQFSGPTARLHSRNAGLRACFWGDRIEKVWWCQIW